MIVVVGVRFVVGVAAPATHCIRTSNSERVPGWRKDLAQDIAEGRRLAVLQWPLADK